VVAINDDDLIADDEVHVPAPLGMDLDERRGNRHHSHVTWHGGANADGEVDVVDARHIAAGQHRLPNLRALLRGQADAAARLALLRLTLLRLSLLRSLAWLTGLTPLRRLTGLPLLTLLALWSLTRGLLALLLPLTTLLGLTLLALLRARFLLALGRLTRGLLALLLPLATLLGLTLLALLRARFLLALGRLTRGLLALLLPLATLLGLTLLALLRARFALTLGRLACGLSFLAALRLALFLSLRGLLGLALLRRRLRLLPLSGPAALLALHGLGRCEGNACQQRSRTDQKLIPHSNVPLAVPAWFG
jgi:hypothetical protein